MLSTLTDEWVMVRAVAELTRTQASWYSDDAIRAVASETSDLDERVRLWARRVADETKLTAEVQAWHRLVNVARALTVIAAWMISLGMYAGGVAIGRPVHPLLAVGLPLLSTLIGIVLWVWMVRPRESVGAADPLLGMGMFAWIADVLATWSARSRPNLKLLADAVWRSISENRAMPWLLSVSNHGLWALAMLLGIVMLLLGYMFMSVSFRVDTTILRASDFDGMMAVLGWGPKWLGVATPASTTPGVVLEGEAARTMALWICGVLTCWGLIPRTLLWFYSRWRLKGLRRELDCIPYDQEPFSSLKSRFEAWDRQAEAERRSGAGRGEAESVAAKGNGQVASPSRRGEALVLWSLPPGADSFLPRSGATPLWTLSASGDEKSRSDVLDKVAQSRPAVVQVVCEGEDSPDLAIRRLLEGLLSQGVHVSLSLWGSDPTDRWSRWIRSVGLVQVRVSADRLGSTVSGEMS